MNLLKQKMTYLMMKILMNSKENLRENFKVYQRILELLERIQPILKVLMDNMLFTRTNKLCLLNLMLIKMVLL